MLRSVRNISKISSFNYIRPVYCSFSSIYKFYPQNSFNLANNIIIFYENKRYYSNNNDNNNNNNEDPNKLEDLTKDENKNELKNKDENTSEQNKDENKNEIQNKDENTSEIKGDQNNEDANLQYIDLKLLFPTNTGSSIASSTLAPVNEFPSSVLALPYSTPLIPGFTSTIVLPKDLAPILHEYQTQGGKYLAVYYTPDEIKEGLATETAIKEEVNSKENVKIGTIAKINSIFRNYHPFHGFYTQLVLSSISRVEIRKGDKETKKSKLHSKKFSLPKVNVKKFSNSEFDEKSAEANAHRIELLSNITSLITKSVVYKNLIAKFVSNPTDIASLVDFSLNCCKTEPHFMQKILEEPNVIERAKLIIPLLKKEEEIYRIRYNMQSEHIQNNNARSVNGGGQQNISTVEKRWRALLEKHKPPAAVQEILNEEMEKFASTPQHSSDYNVSRNYIDWLVQLPWGVYTDDNFDLEAAEDILNKNHYGLKDVKKRILEYIAVGSMKHNIESAGTSGKILCLVGAPGVGKTSIGKSIAAALGRNFQRISVGGMRDTSEIKGHRRTYVGSLPGRIIQAIKNAKSFNPVIVLDEIEKTSKSHDGDPASALLEVLDPEQNKEFLDYYIDFPIDLSKILFICTGNSLSTLPEPLMDRMEILEVPGYTTYEKEKIAQEFLIPKVAEETTVPENAVVLENNILKQIIDEYCREPGVRTLQQKLESLYRQVAVKIVKNEANEISVNSDNIKTLLGRQNFSIAESFLDAPPGVVIGLGYTNYGGNILVLETVAYPVEESKTQPLKLTGNLGEVLVESASIAQTYAMLMLKKHFPNNKFYEKHNISVHLPHGSIKKEGPSAGIALVTALISLSTGIPVNPKLAMTGEVTLTGRIIGVGGIKEKLLGAQRSGITKLCLPEENKYDFDILDNELKDQFESVKFFKHYDNLFEYIFEEGKKQKKE